MFLALVMCLGLVQVTAFAEEEIIPDEGNEPVLCACGVEGCTCEPETCGADFCNEPCEACAAKQQADKEAAEKAAAEEAARLQAEEEARRAAEEAEAAAKLAEAVAALEFMIANLPAPEAVTSEDKAVYDQIAAICAFAEANDLVLTEEQGTVLSLVSEALNSPVVIPEVEESTKLFTVTGTCKRGMSIPEEVNGDTFADAFSCLQEGTISLNDDIVSTKLIDFSHAQNIVLCLNGHKLSFSAAVTGNYCISVFYTSTFTIVGSGEISFADASTSNGIQMNGGTVEIRSGDGKVTLTGNETGNVVALLGPEGQVPKFKCQNAIFDGNVEMNFSNNGGVKWIVADCHFKSNVEPKQGNTRNFLIQEGVTNCTFDKTPTSEGRYFLDTETRSWKDRKLELSKSNIVQNVGDTIALEVTRTVEVESANREIIWGSSNNLIASVDQNGVVTIHRLGLAVITARLPAPEDSFGNFKELVVQCSVTGITADWFNCTECSENSPHLIKTKEDLNNIRTHLDSNGNTTGYFQLANDIVFTARDFDTDGLFYNGGHGFEPIGVYKKPTSDGYGTETHSFNGAVFDGAGHTISGLRIYNDGSYGEFTGLFGHVNGGSLIKNVTLEDCEIECSNASGYNYVGAYAGYIHGNTKIENCAVVNCSITNCSTGPTGGITGRLCTNPTAENCIVDSSIIVGRAASGGICGISAWGHVYGCIVNAVSVSGGYVGGVVGSSGSSAFDVKDTVARTTLSASPDATSTDIRIGGCAGNPYVNVEVSNCIILTNVKSEGMPSGKVLYAGGIFSNTFNHGWKPEFEQWSKITDTYCSFHIANELKSAEKNMVGQLVGCIDRNYPVVTDNMPYFGDSLNIFGGEINTASRPADFPIPNPQLLTAESDSFSLSFEAVDESTFILPEKYWSALGDVSMRPAEPGNYAVIVTYTQGTEDTFEKRTYKLPWYIQVTSTPVNPQPTDPQPTDPIVPTYPEFYPSITPTYPTGGGTGTTTPPSTITDNPTPLDPGTTITDDETPLDRLPLLFRDVADDMWYRDAVAYVFDRGLMKGINETTFAPTLSTERGMIVTILHRLEGEPSAAASAFTDVAAGEWYTDAVAWGAANGVVKGYSDTIFKPTQDITREQLAAILYRYAQLKGYDTGKRADLSAYTDACDISAYALEAMQWAVAEELISGVTSYTLVPGGRADRAQVAMILMRFCENIAESA